MSTLDIIRTLCTKKGISIKTLEKELGFSNGSLAKAATIKAERLQKIAEYFNVSVDYLMTGTEKEGGEPYYLNEDAREMAQFMYENPEYKVLFDASRKISKADIETVKAIMDKFKSLD